MKQTSQRSKKASNNLSELLPPNKLNDPKNDQSLCSIIIGGLDTHLFNWDFTGINTLILMWEALLEILRLTKLPTQFIHLIKANDIQRTRYYPKENFLLYDINWKFNAGFHKHRLT